MPKKLTGSESQLVAFLLQGYNFKTAATMLNLNETTLVFHARNVWVKLGLPENCMPKL